MKQEPETIEGVCAETLDRNMKPLTHATAAVSSCIRLTHVSVCVSAQRRQKKALKRHLHHQTNGVRRQLDVGLCAAVTCDSLICVFGWFE